MYDGLEGIKKTVWQEHTLVEFFSNLREIFSRLQLCPSQAISDLKSIETIDDLLAKRRLHEQKGIDCFLKEIFSCHQGDLISRERDWREGQLILLNRLREKMQSSIDALETQDTAEWHASLEGNDMQSSGRMLKLLEDESDNFGTVLQDGVAKGEFVSSAVTEFRMYKASALGEKADTFFEEPYAALKLLGKVLFACSVEGMGRETRKTRSGKSLKHKLGPIPILRNHHSHLKNDTADKAESRREEKVKMMGYFAKCLNRTWKDKETSNKNYDQKDDLHLTSYEAQLVSLELIRLARRRLEDMLKKV